MMICVSVMLAVFLGWPLAFGGRDAVRIETSRAEARPVAVAASSEQAQLIQASAPAAAPASAQPESCYHRYQREVKACTSANGAACRLKSADNWDLCEATGFWPD
jgi:zona occludens toxin (predicted ATPase)